LANDHPSQYCLRSPRLQCEFSHCDDCVHLIHLWLAAHRVDMGEAVAREPFNLLRLLCSRQVEMKQPAGGGGGGKQNINL